MRRSRTRYPSGSVSTPCPRSMYAEQNSDSAHDAALDAQVRFKHVHGCKALYTYGHEVNPYGQKYVARRFEQFVHVTPNNQLTLLHEACNSCPNYLAPCLELERNVRLRNAVFSIQDS
jgi:hypothetical protein